MPAAPSNAKKTWIAAAGETSTVYPLSASQNPLGCLPDPFLLQLRLSLRSPHRIFFNPSLVWAGKPLPTHLVWFLNSRRLAPSLILLIEAFRHNFLPKLDCRTRTFMFTGKTNKMDSSSGLQDAVSLCAGISKSMEATHQVCHIHRKRCEKRGAGVGIENACFVNVTTSFGIWFASAYKLYNRRTKSDLESV
jgi:hypothetical protein